MFFNPIKAAFHFIIVCLFLIFDVCVFHSWIALAILATPVWLYAMHKLDRAVNY
jgi:hypothetical protein